MPLNYMIRPEHTHTHTQGDGDDTHTHALTHTHTHKHMRESSYMFTESLAKSLWSHFSKRGPSVSH